MNMYNKIKYELRIKFNIRKCIFIASYIVVTILFMQIFLAKSEAFHKRIAEIDVNYSIYNIWDAFMHYLNSNNFMVYIMMPFIIIIASSVWSKNYYHSELYRIKLKSRELLWQLNCYTIIISTTILFIGVLLLNLVIGMILFPYDSQWSLYATTMLDTENLISIYGSDLFTFTPLFATILSVIIIILASIAISLLKNIFTLIVKNETISSIITILIFIMSEESIFGKFALESNITLNNASEFSVLFTFFYWGLCIFIFYHLGLFLCGKVEFIPKKKGGYDT